MDYMGTLIGVITRDTRSLDDSSYNVTSLSMSDSICFFPVDAPWFLYSLT